MNVLGWFVMIAMLVVGLLLISFVNVAFLEEVA